MTIHGNFIYKSKNLETAQVSINSWMDKQIMYIHKMEY